MLGDHQITSTHSRHCRYAFPRTGLCCRPQQEAPFQGCRSLHKKGSGKRAGRTEAYITWRKSCPLAPSRKDGRKSVRRWGIPNQRKRAPIQWNCCSLYKQGVPYNACHWWRQELMQVLLEGRSDRYMTFDLSWTSTSFLRAAVESAKFSIAVVHVWLFMNNICTSTDLQCLYCRMLAIDSLDDFFSWVIIFWNGAIP